MPFLLPLFITIFGLIRAGASAFRDREFRALAFLLAILLVSGMFFYHEVEKWRWLDSLYFSVVTLTTIGYGDLTPHTDAAKIFTMIYIFLGLGVIFGFVNLLADHTRKHQKEAFQSVAGILNRQKQRMFPGNAEDTKKE